MDQRIANPKSILTTTTPYTSGEKEIREFWSTYKKVIGVHDIANIFGTDRHVESGKTIINYNPFHVGSKKFRELCFANNRVIVAHIDQPKWTFFGRLHSLA